MGSDGSLRHTSPAGDTINRKINEEIIAAQIGTIRCLYSNRIGIGLNEIDDHGFETGRTKGRNKKRVRMGR